MGNVKPTLIYLLRDPRDNRVRYVGKTINHKNRYRAHRAPSAQYCCARWLKELRSLGMLPTMEIIETVPPGHDWAEREIYWIAYWREREPDLTNTATGGQTAPSMKQSALTIARRKASIVANHGQLGCFGDAHRKAVSEGLKGRVISEATREKLRQANLGRKDSAETVAKRLAGDVRERIAEGMRRHHAAMTPEEKREFSESRKGKPGNWLGKKRGPLSPEMKAKLSAIHKARLASLTPEQREARMAAAKKANWRNTPQWAAPTFEEAIWHH
jgi:hypothetical protein